MQMNMMWKVLAFAPTPTTPGTTQNPTAEALKLVGMVVFFFVFMYLLMIRPQQKKAKELDRLMKSIKPGDKVVTSSGIVGVVVAVKDKTMSLRSADAKLEILKSTVSDVLEKSGNTSEQN
jgi:preprotein translocase subunit YajC